MKSASVCVCVCVCAYVHVRRIDSHLLAAPVCQFL